MSAEDFSTLTQVSPVLTNERLSEALTKWFGENIQFSHWEYIGETGKGDSYLSEIMRMKIHGKTADGQMNHVQVILKTIPKNVCRRLTFRSTDFFKNEINFYDIVLPALLKFQSTKSIKEPFNNYAKVFLVYSDGLNDTVCLEDATVHNYGSAVRQEGINMQHVRTALKSLAKLHAISFAMKDQMPDEFDKISKAVFETYFDEQLWDWYGKFWSRICGVAIDAVEKEYPDSIYLKKVREFAVPETYKKMIAAVSDKTNGVITHGDTWTNNFLFKYVNSEPLVAKIVDFQLTRYASPVLDIAFLIYACTTQDLRLNYYDEFLKFYYEVLSTQIKDMGSNPDKLYSWETYKSEIKKYSYFGLAYSFESTPAILLEAEEAAEMDIMEGDEKKNIDDFWPIPPIKTKKGRLREADNIVHCVDNGYI